MCIIHDVKTVRNRINHMMRKKKKSVSLPARLEMVRRRELETKKGDDGRRT